jgi:hypothetical protein
VDVDLTGGLDVEREYLFAAQPADPELRESVNVWVWDDGVEFGMPRFGVEAVADQWDTHDLQLNLALRDGRVVTIFGPHPAHPRAVVDGRARTLGAGPMQFEIVEPFRHWRARVEGTARQTTVDAQMGGWFPGGDGEDIPAVVELDIRSAVPPWEVGTLLDEAGRVLATQEEGDLMGGPRYEQLFRATGRVRVGDEEHELHGGGLRVRRSGVRRLAAFRGHAWQSAVFPSGRAFGYIVYPPRTDGKPTLNEGYVFDGDGALQPAWVVEAPWLGQLQAHGEAVPVVLETQHGTTTVHGESLLSTFMVLGPLAGFRLHQAIVRYEWDGETANGMMERSTADAGGDDPSAG